VKAVEKTLNEIKAASELDVEAFVGLAWSNLTISELDIKREHDFAIVGWRLAFSANE
jgi:hypothetical protein